MTDNQRGILGIFLILVIIAGVGDIAAAVLSSRVPPPPDPQVTLGLWKNFPTASACSTGNFTVTACELIGNTSYRQPLSFGAVSIEAGVTPILSVSCITPSNTVGAFLQLQYANFSLTTNLNTSVFVNVPGSLGAGQVFIDNSANNPCQGNMVSSRTLGLTLPAGVGAFVFRVVGSSGGGSGDNPRFSSIAVTVFQTINKILGFIPLSITTASFTARVTIVYPVAAASTGTYQWIATNITSGACGIVGGTIDNCIRSGSGSCSIPIGGVLCQTTGIAFSPVFTGTVAVTGSATGPLANAIIPVASLQLLSAQTVTV